MKFVRGEIPLDEKNHVKRHCGGNGPQHQFGFKSPQGQGQHLAGDPEDGSAGGQGHGVYPNSLASSMRSGRTDSIAIILGEMVNPYNAYLMNHLTTHLHDRGYTTLMFVTNQRRSHEERAVQTAISKNVDAIISATQLRPDNLELIMNLRADRPGFDEAGLLSGEQGRIPLGIHSRPASAPEGTSPHPEHYLPGKAFRVFP